MSYVLIKKANVLAIEIVGIVFIIILGSLLHFTFELSGNNIVVGSFSAVNESVWEHLKLAFWPAAFWMFISMFLLRKSVYNFFTAKTIGAYVMVMFIPTVFYSYTAFTGESNLVVDIASFILAVVLGQIVSIKIYKYKLNKLYEIATLVAIIILAVVFVVFTFYPPNLEIFRDSITGQYGIS